MKISQYYKMKLSKLQKAITNDTDFSRIESKKKKKVEI